jgi:hypothetical protein
MGRLPDMILFLGAFDLQSLNLLELTCYAEGVSLLLLRLR